MLKDIEKVSTGPDLDALVAEDVFGLRSVHRHQGALFGKKQDKLGRWRSAKVPDFSTNPIHASAIEKQMKELGRLAATRFPSITDRINSEGFIALVSP